MTDADPEGDVLVVAGGHLFRTHRHILQTNSGYFKSFQNDPSWSTVSPISLPTIPSSSFADLLHFMYTGQLCVTTHNIYELLLCAQMLHMPNAIEICRQFLLGSFALPKDPQTPFRQQFFQTNHQLNHSSNMSSCIVRPIPIKRLFIPEFTVPSWRPEASTSTSTQHPNAEDGATNRSVPNINQDIAKSNENSDDIVVVDVACCDGPVTFERIINENYKHVQPPSLDTVPQEPSPLSPAKTIDLNNEQEPNSAESSQTSSSTWNVRKSIPSAVRFTCVYCNHLFKSRYCYQKHKQRHINPIPTDKTEKPTQPKDKNVTFYPCKSCGAKFPSYYFVHKHRRHCHSLANKRAE